MVGSRMMIVGKALAEPARAAMFGRLMSGTAHTATELAAAAQVAASTASEHLRIMADAGLVVVEASGRHRYYRLASPDIAAWLEKIDSLDLPHEVRPSGTVVQRADTALSLARSCYDHLAGRVGVQLYDALARRGTIEFTSGGATVTSAGRDHLADLGVDIGPVEANRRPAIRICLDWTERRHHLAGALGAAVLTAFLDQHWFTRKPSDRRLLVPTAVGRVNLAEHFGIQ